MAKSVKKTSKSKKPKFVNVQLDLPDHVILALCLEAHEYNITLNQLCNIIISEYIKNNPR